MKVLAHSMDARHRNRRHPVTSGELQRGSGTPNKVLAVVHTMLSPICPSILPMGQANINPCEDLL